MTKQATYPRRGLHGEIVHTIGLRILRGELQPGDLLPDEEELSADLSVSRTVLREAVRVLAAKGLVQARPKTGTRVRSRSEWNLADPDVLSWRIKAGPDRELYEQVTEVRLGLEPQAARLAATRATEAEIAEIGESYAAMEAGVRDAAAYLAADLLFHERILAACHNELLGHLGGVLRDLVRTTFEFTTSSPTSRKRALPLHGAILDGIAIRSEAAAEAAMRTLIADTASYLHRARSGKAKRR
jgi:GntR family galactonate operon transcriptional repressor